MVGPLTLHSLPNKWVLQAKQDKEGKCLCIDKVNAGVEQVAFEDLGLNQQQQQADECDPPRDFEGLIGFFQGLVSLYLVVISESVLVGSFGSHDVFGVVRCELIQLTPQPESNLHSEEKGIIDNILLIVNSGHLFYSHSLDVTNTIQRRNSNKINLPAASQPLAAQADPRFFWNFKFSRLLQEKNLHNWILPIIYGFVCFASTHYKENEFQYWLFSRRSRFRMGTRYHMRGVNSRGHVANFVETEQIVCANGRVSSFVQTRGSIPVFWKQVTGLNFRPVPTLDQHLAANRRAFVAHFNEQIRIYGFQLIVSLINQTGREEMLGDAYKEQFLLMNDPRVRYEDFDFHRECSGVNFSRLCILTGRTKQSMKQMGFFSENESGYVLQSQSGVIRTNCIDCLDRTNVVQTKYARKMLHYQLRSVGVMQSGDLLLHDQNLEKLFKFAWADNGDALSKQYTTTGALKGDFTRTGKRRIQGLFQDGLNSLMRYYQNTFNDFIRQDYIDLVCGRAYANGSPRLQTTTATTATSSTNDNQNAHQVGNEHGNGQVHTNGNENGHVHANGETGDTASTSQSSENTFEPVFVTSALQVLPTGDPRAVALELEMFELGRNRKDNFLIWTSQERVAQKVNVKDMIQIEKSEFDNKSVRLLFTPHEFPTPLELWFAGPIDCEKFIQALHTARKFSGIPVPDGVRLKCVTATYIEQFSKSSEATFWKSLQHALVGNTTNANIEHSMWRGVSMDDMWEGDSPKGKLQHSQSTDKLSRNASASDGNGAILTPKRSPEPTHFEKMLNGDLFMNTTQTEQTAVSKQDLDAVTHRCDVFALGCIGTNGIFTVYHKCKRLLADQFEVIALHTFGSICLLVFVKLSILPMITCVRLSTALVGKGRNSGAAISLSMKVQDTPLCLLFTSLPKEAGKRSDCIGRVMQSMTMGLTTDLQLQHQHVIAFGLDVPSDTTHSTDSLSSRTAAEDFAASSNSAAGPGVDVVVGVDTYANSDEESGSDNENETTHSPTTIAMSSQLPHRSRRSLANIVDPFPSTEDPKQQPNAASNSTAKPQLGLVAWPFLDVHTQKGTAPCDRRRFKMDDPRGGLIGYVGIDCSGPHVPGFVPRPPGSKRAAGENGWAVSLGGLEITISNLPKKVLDSAVYCSIGGHMVTRTTRTAVVKGDSRFCWPDRLTLHLLPMTSEFLRENASVTVQVFREEAPNDRVIASGRVAICGAKLNCDLLMFGRKVGTFGCSCFVEQVRKTQPKDHQDFSLASITDAFGRLVPNRTPADQANRLPLERLNNFKDTPQIGFVRYIPAPLLLDDAPTYTRAAIAAATTAHAIVSLDTRRSLDDSSAFTQKIADVFAKPLSLFSQPNTNMKPQSKDNFQAKNQEDSASDTEDPK